MKKRIIAYALAALMALSAIVILPVSAKQSGNWEYYLNGSEASIYKYLGADAHVDFPSSLDGNPVTKIESGALRSNTSITSVTIPSGVKEIGSSAFSECPLLTSVVLPDSITTIGKWAFNECPTLAEINLPANLASLEDYVFYNCVSLKSITIPGSVISIGETTFRNCSSLKTVNFSEGLASIGYASFRGCSSLTEVTLPDSLTTLGVGVFFDCTALTTVKLSKNLTVIGDSAFAGCLLLEEIDIPGTVTTIGKSAFQQCASLKRVTMPQSVTALGTYAFQGCASLEELPIPTGITVLPESAFYGCSSVISITIPDNIKVLSEYSLGNCDSLTDVTIPTSVTTIDSTALTSCNNLNKIYYAGSEAQWEALLKGHTYSSLQNCTAYCEWKTYGDLLYVIDENGDAIIGGDLGKNTSVTIPASIDGHPVKMIGPYAFYNRFDLKSVTIPEGVNVIGTSAFQNCTLLASPKLPQSLTAINESAFNNCSNFMSISIPKNVRILGERAFLDCVSVTEMTYEPETLDTFGDYVFDNIGKNAEKGVEVVFGKSVVKVPAYMFYSFREGTVFNVKSALFAGSNVTDIESSAFRGCTNMTVASIPASVQRIGFRVFDDCRSLQTVYYGGTRAQFDALLKYTSNDVLLSVNVICGYIPPVDTKSDHDSVIDVPSGGVTPGDANGDGSINAKDVTAIMKYIVGKTPKGFIPDAADFNKDGKTNAKDVVAIMKYIVSR